MKKKIFSVLLALVLVLSFSLVTAVPVGAQEGNITIDGVLSDGEWDDHFWFTDNEGNEYFGGVPEFTYYKTNDDQYLYIATVVNDPTPLAEANDEIFLAFRDSESNHHEFRKGYTADPEQYGKYYHEPYDYHSLPLPEGVEFGWGTDDSHVYYEWKIPLELLDINPGETIKYLTHVREWSQRKINYHPEVTSWAPYADINQFGDLTLWMPPPTKADILKDSGVPGKGLEKAPGQQKPFNPDSKAGEHAGKK